MNGLHLPAQIVVTKELDHKRHRSLRVLSEDVLEEDARAFIEDARKLTAQGDLRYCNIYRDFYHLFGYVEPLQPDNMGNAPHMVRNRRIHQ